MCCLFGMIDTQNRFAPREREKILHALAAASEARGTDAAGIAYLSRGKIHTYKRPVPGRRLKIRLPHDASVIMGHARLTTQGDEKRNFNNHPLQARAGVQGFALAHNGVIRNDRALRKQHHLPRTNIETDNYVAVQLLQQSGAISFQTLRDMAEQLEGSFTFTVLDGQNNLYFIMGDNPLCIYHYQELGLYLYASTEPILANALQSLPYDLGQAVPIPVDCGEILRISRSGKQGREWFDDSMLFGGGFRWYSYAFPWRKPPLSRSEPGKDEYQRELKSVAGYFGVSPREIDQLLAVGFTCEEIEDYLYGGEI